MIASLARPDRIELFPITPLPVSSSEIRDLVANGLPIDDLVPPAVARRLSIVSTPVAPPLMSANRRYTPPHELRGLRRARRDR